MRSLHYLVTAIMMKPLSTLAINNWSDSKMWIRRLITCTLQMLPWRTLSWQQIRSTVKQLGSTTPWTSLKYIPHIIIQSFFFCESKALNNFVLFPLATTADINSINFCSRSNFCIWTPHWYTTNPYCYYTQGKVEHYNEVWDLAIDSLNPRVISCAKQWCNRDQLMTLMSQSTD